MKYILTIGLYLIVAAGVGGSCAGQDNKVTQRDGVDNTRMGAYRALAQLSFRAFQKGDNATAAELARVLERTWDQGEWHNISDDSFCKANRSVCQPIDSAMDVFIGAIINYSTNSANASAVQTAYDNFLEKLKTAD
jgi:hypothetical protein